jgi:hypothetical protein
MKLVVFMRIPLTFNQQKLLCVQTTLTTEFDRNRTFVRAWCDLFDANGGAAAAIADTPMR